MEGQASQEVYTIGELADLAGVTARTVRYYTAEGLLPPPDLQGKYGLYNQNHLDRLLLIKHLKDAFFPLHEIRARMGHLSPAEVRELLSHYSAPPALPSPGAAGQISSEARKQTGALRETSSAADYIAQVLSRRAVGPAAPAPAPPPAAAPTPPLARVAQPAQAAAETWRRIVLAPGVEVHARESAAAELDPLLNDLIAYAQRLFQPQEDNHDD